MYKAVFFFVLAYFACVSGLQLENCGGIPKMEARLDSCTVPPCGGRNHTIDMVFTSNTYTTSLDFDILVRVLKGENKFSVNKSGNFCNHLVDGHCPLEVGSNYRISYQIYLPGYKAEEHLRGAVLVKDDKGKLIICRQIPDNPVNSVSGAAPAQHLQLGFPYLAILFSSISYCIN